MNTQPTQPVKSELQMLLAQIDAQYDSARQALYGLAQGTARHDIINARMEKLGLLFEQMSEVVGDKGEAMRLFASSLDQENEGQSSYGSALC